MPHLVSQADILSVRADAVVVCVEVGELCTEGESCRRLAEAGGEALRWSVVRAGFLPVGSAAHTECPALPFRHVLLCAAPHWLTGKANELLILHRCYQSLFALAEEQGCRSLAVIGTGNMGSEHCRMILEGKCPEVRLCAAADLRPERREVAPVPYFEACYRVGNNPLQEPLPEAEIARLRQIYAETDW